MAHTGHPFFHLLPSANLQIQPDIFTRPKGVFATSEREAENISISKKLTKLAS